MTRTLSSAGLLALAAAALASGAGPAFAGKVISIVGPGDRKQTVVVHDIKRPQHAYEFRTGGGGVVALMDTNDRDPFIFSDITRFTFTSDIDGLLQEPISHLEVLFTESSGPLTDNGSGDLVGVREGEQTIFTFVFPGEPSLSGHLRFDPATPCPADFNQDGAVNSDDFFDFLNAFYANDPGADVNGDGAVNSDDFFDFLNTFFTGC